MERARQRHVTTATTYKEIVGRILQKERKERFPDQVKFAKKVGISQPTISRFESGGGGMSIEALKRLTDALGTTPSEIFRRADQGAEGLATRGIRVIHNEADGEPNLAFLGKRTLRDLLDGILGGKK